MYQTCHHVMPNGLRCQSPAMRGCAFCYFHGRRVPVRKAAPAATRIQMPAALDRKGITETLHQVLNALANNKISARRASILLYGLQMAIKDPEVAAAAPVPTAINEIDPDQIDLAQLSPLIEALLGQKSVG